jgi:flagellar hook-basal body complex protein FliE
MARGDLIALNQSHPAHMGNNANLNAASGEQSFGNMLFDALNEVNDLQNNAQDLATIASINPSAVDAHDVSIASAKATMALNLTKNVVDRVIQAYREITTLR